MASSPSPASSTDPVDQELDRLIDEVGYSPKEAGKLIGGGVTGIYEDIKAGLLDYYWDRGRKITGASIRRRIKQKLETTANEPLRRAGPGRPKKKTQPENA